MQTRASHRDPDPDDDPDLDPLESLAIIDAQRAHVRDRVEIDGRVVFGAWGLAWSIGYLALHASVRDTADGQAPAWWGFTTFFVLLAAALAVTLTHVGRRTAGLRGESSTTGALLGVAWCTAFGSVFAVMAALGRSGAGGSIDGVLANTIPCLVVGVLYMGQGAAWNDRRQVALGAWICVVTAIAALVGVPGLYLVMAIAGGGGFVVCAVVEQVMRRRWA